MQKTFAKHYLESFGVNTDSLSDAEADREFRNVTLDIRSDLLDEPRPDSLYTHDQAGYTVLRFDGVEEICVACRNYVPGGGCLLVRGGVNPAGTCNHWQGWSEEPAHHDSDEPTKKVIKWNGLKIGITHEADDLRFGYPLQGISYGRIYGSYGQAEDGRAIDCWVGPDLESDKAFWFQQIDPNDGSPDEVKLVIGFPDRMSAKQAVQGSLPMYLRDQMFGGLFDVDPVELDAYRDSVDDVEHRTDAVDQAELDAVYAKYHQTVNMSASQLKSWAESDDSKKASLDRSPIKRNLRLLSKPKDEWTQADIRDTNRTVSFVSRMKGAEKGKPVDAKTKLSKRDISLRNWAYNPQGRNDNSETKEKTFRDTLRPPVSFRDRPHHSMDEQTDDRIFVTIGDAASIGAPARGLEDVEDKAPNYRLGDSDEYCMDCIYSRTGKPNENGWLYCRKYNLEVDPSGLCDDFDRGDRSDARKIWVPAKGDREGYWRTDPRTKKIEPTATKGSAFISASEFQKLKLQGLHSSFAPSDESITHSMNNTYWVEGGNGERSLLKVAEGFDSAKELLVSEIALNADVPCQWVKGVPAAIVDTNKGLGLDNPGSGTLHHVLPGKPVEDLINEGSLPNKYKDFDMQGIMGDYLKTALQHPDLARIAGMDAALGNSDRHEGNLMHDLAQNRFYAIDNGNTFGRGSSGDALLEEVKVAYGSHRFQEFSREEKKNLKLLSSTIDRIVKTSSPDSLSKRLDRYCTGLYGDWHDKDDLLHAQAMVGRSFAIASQMSNLIKTGLKS
jgi:hypothetical protein